VIGTVSLAVGHPPLQVRVVDKQLLVFVDSGTQLLSPIGVGSFLLSRGTAGRRRLRQRPAGASPVHGLHPGADQATARSEGTPSTTGGRQHPVRVIVVVAAGSSGSLAVQRRVQDVGRRGGQVRPAVARGAAQVRQDARRADGGGARGGARGRPGLMRPRPHCSVQHRRRRRPEPAAAARRLVVQVPQERPPGLH